MKIQSRFATTFVVVSGDFEGDLVPRSNHDMCFRQHRLVDRRAFLIS
jgi:hypothetical protein